MTKIGKIAAVAALTVGALALTGCPSEPDSTDPAEIEKNPPVVATDAPTPAST